jgi:hypothetical protein
MEISLVFMWLLNLAKSANTSFAPMTATGMSDNHLWGNVDLKSDSLALQMR